MKQKTGFNFEMISAGKALKHQANTALEALIYG
jgi:hypothetical protein